MSHPYSVIQPLEVVSMKVKLYFLKQSDSEIRTWLFNKTITLASKSVYLIQNLNFDALYIILDITFSCKSFLQDFCIPLNPPNPLCVWKLTFAPFFFFFLHKKTRDV